MIEIAHIEQRDAWDDYVSRHPHAHAYHFFDWQKVIAGAYGHKTYPLAALDGSAPGGASARIVGILPLVHMKSPLAGNRLVSMPFFDHGGILADHSAAEAKLLDAAAALARRVKARSIELRHLEPIDAQMPCAWTLRSHKVRMLLPLADSSEELMKSFKSKLRSQINRPIKAGMVAKVGGQELLDDFYRVFCINMRDLGSPVHAKSMPATLLKVFTAQARIVVVYQATQPVAAALMVGIKNVMANPWASALRQYSKESPNMLLYWQMLSYAADHGFQYFDFGRSTPDEGTYRFKAQWGAQPHAMHWYTIRTGHAIATGDAPGALPEPAKRGMPDNKKRQLAVAIWQRLPISLSRTIGPLIRKHIDL